MNEKNDQPSDDNPEKSITDAERQMQEALEADEKAATKEQPEESMTDVERQMQEALESDAKADKPAATKAGKAAPKEAEQTTAKPVSVPVHQVDVDSVKTVPKAPADMDSNLKLILDIPVEVKVEVGHSRLSIREVLNLGPGAIVELDRTAGSPADLIVNGTKVGHGDVVVVDESYGIRITKLVDPQDRINSLS